ncbi:alpha/beta hydrolase [Nisaea sediminum]|uniref:alpha/beta hydrolase n=1 Tax=Nisaea sediminum TaxID=2775867 RepID=UPI001865D75F|nr:alpha/beta hydrolase family protein [Nisaea sediminum]
MTLRTLLATGAVYLSLMAAAAADLQESLSLESPALGREMKYSLYLPEQRSGVLPALYLLHGLGGNERDWQTLGEIRQTADRLIAEKAIPPLAIVMPDAGNSWYINSPAHGAYEDAILKDLIPQVEVRHSIGGTAADRAIAGLSMGGYGALRLAFRNPGTFAMTGALSAAIFPDLARREDVTEQQIGFFKGAFGTPFDIAAFNRENFFADIPSLAAAKARPAIFVTVGDDDGFGLYEGNVALYLALKRAGVPVEFRMTDGNHTWKLWREEIEDVLRYYGEVLRARAG